MGQVNGRTDEHEELDMDNRMHPRPDRPTAALTGSRHLTASSPRPEGGPRLGSTSRRPVRRWIVALLALIGGLIAAPQAGAAPSPNLPPLYDARLYGEGTSVVASYKTIGAVRTMAVVATAPLPAGHDLYGTAGMNDRVASIVTTYSGTTHLAVSYGLKSGTPYYVQLYTQGGNGQWVLQQRNLTVRTKDRYVRAHFDKIKIRNDGDPMGCGELQFQLKVAGAWGDEPYFMTNENSMCTGETYNMNIVSPWVKVNADTTTAYSLGQDDDYYGGVLCTYGFGGCGDNAQKTVTLYLSTMQHGETRPMSVWANGGFEFQWLGEYEVEYR
jgi:hypothetical protein